MIFLDQLFNNNTFIFGRFQANEMLQKKTFFEGVFPVE